MLVVVGAGPDYLTNIYIFGIWIFVCLWTLDEVTDRKRSALMTQLCAAYSQEVNAREMLAAALVTPSSGPKDLAPDQIIIVYVYRSSGAHTMVFFSHSSVKLLASNYLLLFLLPAICNLNGENMQNGPDGVFQPAIPQPISKPFVLFLLKPSTPKCLV